eukprot:g5879.t1
MATDADDNGADDVIVKTNKDESSESKKLVSVCACISRRESAEMVCVMRVVTLVTTIIVVPGFYFGQKLYSDGFGGPNSKCADYMFCTEQNTIVGCIIFATLGLLLFLFPCTSMKRDEALERGYRPEPHIGCADFCWTYQIEPLPGETQETVRVSVGKLGREVVKVDFDHSQTHGTGAASVGEATARPVAAFAVSAGSMAPM